MEYSQSTLKISSMRKHKHAATACLNFNKVQTSKACFKHNINELCSFKKLECRHTEVSVTKDNRRGRENGKNQLYCILKNCSEDNKIINI